MEAINSKALRPWALGILIILFPIWLTDLFGPRSKRSVQDRKPAPATSVAKPSLKPSLKLHAPTPIDRDSFLASFIRQAGADLIPCVRAAIGPTGSITFLARLTQRGELTAVRMIEPRSLECAVEAARAMNFATVTSAMKQETVEINWRFDW